MNSSPYNSSIPGTCVVLNLVGAIIYNALRAIQHDDKRVASKSGDESVLRRECSKSRTRCICKREDEHRWCEEGWKWEQECSRN